MPRGGPDWGLYAPQKTVEQLLREGNAFGHEVNQVGAPAKFTWLQVWNPPDSLVDALVYRIDHTAGDDVRIDLSLGSTQFATDLGAGANRRAGGAASDLHVYAKTDAGGTTVPVIMGRSVSTAIRSIYPCYIWVPPGYSCDLTVKTVNVAMTALWWWFEFVSQEV